nr:hypothetical protein BaRGS_021495 [Batillaria attramentaria]
MTTGEDGHTIMVVNYGLGGHYVAHWDPVQVSHAHELQNSGLSDVDKGGQTVFINAGMSVAPIKGAALFWYNYNPAMKLEHQTLHAGCPVLKGHKWK